MTDHDHGPQPEQPTGPSEAQQEYANLGNEIIDKMPDFAPPSPSEDSTGPKYESPADTSAEHGPAEAPVFKEGMMVARQRKADGMVEYDWKVLGIVPETGQVQIGQDSEHGQVVNYVTPDELAGWQPKFTEGQIEKADVPGHAGDYIVVKQSANGMVKLILKAGEDELDNNLPSPTYAGAQIQSWQENGLPSQLPSKPEKKGFLSRFKR